MSITHDTTTIPQTRSRKAAAISGNSSSFAPVLAAVPGITAIRPSPVPAGYFGLVMRHAGGWGTSLPEASGMCRTATGRRESGA